MSDSIASDKKGVPPTKAETRFSIPADMALYAALAGKTPEIDPTAGDPMDEGPWHRGKYPSLQMLRSLPTPRIHPRELWLSTSAVTRRCAKSLGSRLVPLARAVTQ
jgi:hypothetical protein